MSQAHATSYCTSVEDIKVKLLARWTCVADDKEPRILCLPFYSMQLFFFFYELLHFKRAAAAAAEAKSMGYTYIYIFGWNKMLLELGGRRNRASKESSGMAIRGFSSFSSVVQREKKELAHPPNWKCVVVPAFSLSSPLLFILFHFKSIYLFSDLLLASVWLALLVLPPFFLFILKISSILNKNSAASKSQRVQNPRFNQNKWLELTFADGQLWKGSLS